MRLSPTTVNLGRESCSRFGNRDGAYIDAELAPFRRSLGDEECVLPSESRPPIAWVWISSLSALRVGVACRLSPVEANEAIAGETLLAGAAGMEARFARLAFRDSSPMTGNAVFLGEDGADVVGARVWRMASSSIHHSVPSSDGPAVRAIRGPPGDRQMTGAEMGFWYPLGRWGAEDLQRWRRLRSGLHAAIGDVGPVKKARAQLNVGGKKQRGEREIPAHIPPWK